MKKFLLLAFAVIVTVAFAVPALAATTNPSPASPGYTPVIVKFAGYTSTRTGAATFKAPAGFTIKHASVAARAVTGTSPTLKVKGRDGAFTRYSGTLNTAGTVKDLSLTATPNMTDEATQNIDFILGGTSPTFTDITLFLWLKRK